MNYSLDNRETTGLQDDNLGRYLEEELINRLGVSRTLTGHTGCVNTLKWNQGGTIIASGSDDRTVKLWTIAGDLVASIETGHDANIFGVEFIPNGSDRIIASAAGDHAVKLHDLDSSDGVPVRTWNADGRIKRLATALDDPFLFWSASEDGHVRQYDTRFFEEQSLIKAPGNLMVKTMAICQGRTELVAVGTNHPKTNVYDRRNPSKPLLTVASNDFVCHADTLVFTTHVAFNELGTQLLVNQGGGNIFVFNLFDNETTVMEKFEQVVTDSSVPDNDGLSELYGQQRKDAKGLFTERKYYEAIEIYNTLIAREKQAPVYDRCTFFTNRAMGYMCRRWIGDTYAAIKDNLEALRIFPGNAKALWRLARGLILLEQFKMASKCVELFKAKFPDDESVNRLEAQVNEGLLTDSKEAHELIAAAPFRDYRERYCGAQNFQTDMKEANFFGSKEDYIVAGSDCGTLYIWSRSTGNILAGFKADDDILNIVQPHPGHFMLATSGIENVVKFWEPIPEDVEEERRIRNLPEFMSTRVTSGGFGPFLRLAGVRHMQANPGGCEIS